MRVNIDFVNKTKEGRELEGFGIDKKTRRVVVATTLRKGQAVTPYFY